MYYLFAFLLAELALAAPTSFEHKSSSFTSKLGRFTPSLQKREEWQQWTNGTATGQLAYNQEYYFANVEIEGQTLQLVVDAGSSDTWFTQKDFHCWNTGNDTTFVFSGVPQIPCNYGALYSPGAGFKPINNFTQYSCYGQGNEDTLRCVGGEFGKADVTISGLKIPDTIVGAPLNSSAYNPGTPIFSGILGMAFPRLTSGVNSTGGRVEYPSILQNAFYDQNLPIEKKWSLAISRDQSKTGDAGTFTIGGIPDLNDPSINATLGYTSAPFEKIGNLTELAFYAISVDGFSFGEETADGLQVIIDSGAAIIELPEALATSINSQWTPPGQDDGQGDIILDCGATITNSVGITIGGTTLFIEPEDLIVSGPNGTCLSAVTPGVSTEFILGDPLLKNTLAVFDWEGSQMSFYPRQYYKS